MGWLWSSTPDPRGVTPLDGDGTNTNAGDSSQAHKTVGLTESQRARIFGSLPPSKTDTSETREEKADPEIDAFLKSFIASEGAASRPTPTGALPEQSSQQQTTPQPTQRTDHERILPDGSLNIHPDAIYPRTMSCRQAFDQAFYCQSLGGKFNDIYRFGHLKDCNEQWGAFWFCMRTRTIPDKDRQGMIRDYYAERDERRRKEYGSSEDVWDIREKAVERAFWKDPDAEDDGHGVQIQE